MPIFRTRHGLFTALALLFLLADQGLIVASDRLAANAVEWRRHTQEALLAIGAISERKNDAESLTREYAITGAEPLAGRAQAAIRAIRSALDDARRTLRENPAQVGRLDQLDTVLTQRSSRFLRLIETRRTAGAEAAARIVSEGTGRRLSDRAAAILGMMKDEEQRLLVARSARAARYSGWAFSAAILGGALAALFGIFAIRAMAGQARERAAADALRIEAAAQFRSLTEAMPDAVFINQDDTIAFANAAAARLLGVAAPEALLGRSPWEFIRDGTHGSVREQIGTIMAHGGARTVEGVYQQADGREIPLDVSAVHTVFNGRPAVHVIAHDLRERVRSEAELDRFFSLSLDMLCISSEDGHFKRVSPAFTHTLGWTADEMLARPFRAFVHPDDLDATLREVERQVVAGERVLAFRNRYLHKDGSWRVLSWKSVPQPGGLMYAVARDVTEEAKATEALAKSEAMFSTLIEQAPDAMVVVDHRGLIRRVNAQFEVVFGFSRTDVLGQPIEVLVPDSIRPRHEALRDGYLNDPKARTLGAGRQLTARRKDGSELDVDISLSPIDSPDGRLVLAAIRDVSAQRQIERALRESEERFRLLADTMPDAVMASQDGKVVYANAAAARLLGAAMPDEVTALDLFAIIDPAQHEAARHQMQRAAAGENLSSIQQRFVRLDGSLVPVEITAGALLWRGRPALQVVVRDVTDRERTGQELRLVHGELQRLNAELVRASQLKDEFLANMSHELRTPLNAILGLSETLLEQLADTLTPRQAKSLTTIAASGEHLLAVINDILDLSKVEAGKLVLSVDTLDVQEFCDSCLAFVRTQAMHKHLGVAFEHDGRMARFQADAKRFKQVLVNLLTNAVKFTPEGGRIGLTVAAEGEDGLRFTVWDTGIGITRDDQTKLFSPFTQIDSGLTRQQEGTGLGLALVARLAELHGGSVALESKPGQGSRFSVTIPVRSVLAGESTATAAAEGAGAAPSATDRRSYRHALIIEDDPTAGEQLMRYLTELGLTSVLQVHGHEAVAAARRELPDIIVLDILLPSESGWIVLARLKDHPQTRDIPVVVVSIVDEPQKSHALGAAAHFTKPVTRAQLADFLQHAPVQFGRSISRAPRAQRATGPAILLAEDNEANVHTIGGYLEDKGYAIHHAANGALAVQLTRELHPALILMDIQMPVKDGLTAIREIRADPALKDIPIIALTALAMPGDRERCLAAGATDYMSKPISLKALEALVERLVPRSGKDAQA